MNKKVTPPRLMIMVLLTVLLASCGGGSSSPTSSSGSSGSSGTSGTSGTPSSPSSPTTKYSLIVKTFGKGSVSSTPAGIDCGTTCTYAFPAGTAVVLTASASASEYLAQWIGCDSTSGNQCTIDLKDQRFAEPIFASSTPVQLKPSVVVLSKATVDAIQAHSPGMYVFTAGTTAAQNLAPGDVIVGLGTTMGVLARVTSVTVAANGSISVSTIPARLTDVYAEGTLWYSEPLTQAEVKKIKILTRGVRIKNSGSSSSDQFTADLAATVVGSGTTGGNSVSLSGTLTLSFQPVFAINFSLIPPGVQQFQTDLITTSTQTIGTAINIPACTNTIGQLLNGKQAIYEMQFDPIPVSVGIWITPIVTVYVGVNGQADCSIQTSVSANESLTGGIEYTSTAGWQPISSLNTSFTYQPPVFKAAMNVSAYAGPQFTADIDDIAGPFFNVEGYAKAYAYGETGSTNADGWDLYAGVDANVGLEADILGYDLGQYQVQIYNYEKTLDSGTISVIQSTAAPSTPKNLVASAVSSSAMQLQWGSSTDSVGISYYNLYTGTTLLGKFTNTSAQDTGLSPSTKYCFDVVAVDVNGNDSSPSATECATTPPATDTSQPTVPTGVTTAASNSSTIILSWQAATDNVYVAGYTIDENGTPIGTSSTTTFTDALLTPGTRYCFTVSAFDEAGNSSAQSSQACTTTPTGTAATLYTSSTAPAQTLSMPSGYSQYFYIGSTAGGTAACGCTGGYGQNPMSAISWNQDLGVIASASGNMSISIGRSSSNQGAYVAAAGNKGIAGFAVNGYTVSQVYTGYKTPGTTVSISFVTNPDDLELIAAGGQGTGDITLGGIVAKQLVDSTYSEGGSDVIASQAFYVATLPAGQYTVNLSSTTYATNASAALGAVVYVFAPTN